MGTSLQTYNLIAIAGLKNTGKDTAAKMLYYLLNAPKCFRTYRWYNWLKKWPFKNKWHITAFAKPLKETLSIIMNKPVCWFDNRQNKENMYVNLQTLKTYQKFKLHDDLKLSESKFQKLLKTENPIPQEYLLSIRQLMQYYGTSVIRRFLGDKVWINATLNKTNNHNLIVSDLRFKIELEEIKKRGGCCIYIVRNGTEPGLHSSEREVIEMNNDKQFDYIVCNDGDLEDLFNCLKSII